MKIELEVNGQEIHAGETNYTTEKHGEKKGERLFRGRSLLQPNTCIAFVFSG